MIAEFNVPPETPLADLPTEFMPLADQSPEVAGRPPQVINEDSLAVNASGGSADEDDEVVQIDKPAGFLSSEDHPPNHPN